MASATSKRRWRRGWRRTALCRQNLKTGRQSGVQTSYQTARCRQLRSLLCYGPFISSYCLKSGACPSDDPVCRHDAKWIHCMPSQTCPFVAAVFHCPNLGSCNMHPTAFTSIQPSRVIFNADSEKTAPSNLITHTMHVCRRVSANSRVRSATPGPPQEIIFFKSAAVY